MDLGLKGKRGLVSGASSGLGLAAAKTLAAEGVQLVINSRSEFRLEQAAAEIEKATGVKPMLAAGDLSKESERRKVIESALDQVEGGVIDILVSNAGGPPPGAFLEHDSKLFEEAAGLVLDSAVGLTHGLLPKMIEQNWGRLIYITSVGVLQPIDALILSNTYRSAVTGFCKTISNTYAQHGITANCVCPGYTATERLNNLAEKTASETGKLVTQVIEDYAALIPARRVGKPEELASLITFLASERAGYITGTSIPVDGGLHKGLL